MGLKQACDVFDTVKDVVWYRITIGQPIGPGVDAALENAIQYSVHLSPRGLERLERLIERGLSPPTPRKRKAKEVTP
jgi:hypothetical protein